MKLRNAAYAKTLHTANNCSNTIKVNKFTFYTNMDCVEND